MITTVNPATGENLEGYPEHGAEAVEARIQTAAEAFLQWRQRPLAERATLLSAVADALESGREEHARLMTLEMGKPIAASRAEVDKCAWVCRHYAEHAEGYLQPNLIQTDASRSYVRYDPIGAVLAVMPWNFPYWQVFRFAAPALMLGNVGLLKHASNVTGCSLAIEALFREAGFPEGAFGSLLIPGSRVAPLLDDDRLAAATLTGSEPAGASVAAAAGRNVKKTVLELGGSDPFVVLADADVAKAAEVAVVSRMINSGQSCISAKRFIVEEPTTAAFTDAMLGHVEALVVGDPLDEATQIGPLARQDLVDDLDSQVQRTRHAGARVLSGGKPLMRAGFFYAPTVLADVEPEHAAAVEETFGPVAAILTARDADHAVQIANASRFGLGASLWTADLDRAADLAARIETGNVFVNGLVKSDPRLPFGGVKRSGYGRELAAEGIREFANTKTVWIA